MRFRCRSSQGTHTITLGGGAEATLADLRQEICSAVGDVGADPSLISITFGFPPKSVPSSEDGEKTLDSLGIKDGEALQVTKSAATSTTTTTEQRANAFTSRSVAEISNPPQTSAAFTPSSAPSSASSASGLGVSLSDGSQLVKRVIVSDNSCLFNAVGYVMERDRNRSKLLRAVVAKTVASDPLTYNEAFLEKSNEAYCKWITDPMRWGGAIELSILSKHFQREICAFDIQTKRVDVYGQGCGYKECAMVIYDGLHYDALALSAFDGAPEEIDVTLFELATPLMAGAMAAAKELVAQMHSKKQFTDTANFTLRCVVCQQGLRGEKEAQDHARQTGHVNFAEY